MSFTDWKKLSKTFAALNARVYQHGLVEVCQAAYKAGERQGRKDAETIAANAIALRDDLRSNVELTGVALTVLENTMNDSTTQKQDEATSAASELNAGLGTADVLHNLKRFARSPGYFEIEWIEDAIAEIARLRGIEITAKKLVKQWAHDRKMLKDEINALRNLATCSCGDEFTKHDKGQCGKCISTITAAYSVKIIGLEDEIANLTPNV